MRSRSKILSCNDFWGCFRGWIHWLGYLFLILCFLIFIWYNGYWEKSGTSFQIKEDEFTEKIIKQVMVEMKVNQRQDCPQNIPLFYPVYQPFQFPCHANFNSQINDPCKRSHYCEKPGFGISSEGNSKGSLKFKIST